MRSPVSKNKMNLSEWWITAEVMLQLALAPTGVLVLGLSSNSCSVGQPQRPEALAPRLQQARGIPYIVLPFSMIRVPTVAPTCSPRCRFGLPKLSFPHDQMHWLLLLKPQPSIPLQWIAGSTLACLIISAPLTRKTVTDMLSPTPAMLPLSLCGVGALKAPR